MAYQPPKTSSSPVIDFAPPLLQETRPETFASDSKAIPTADDTQPMGSLPHRIKALVRHWASMPAVRVFCTLLLIAVVAFIPALFSNSHDLKVSQKGLTGDLEKIPSDANGVVLFGQVSHFDWSGTQTFHVSWSLYGWGSYTLLSSGYPNKAMDVYISNFTSPAYSYDPDQSPVTRDSDAVSLANTDFSTDHNVYYENSEFYAPNDWYYFMFTAFVIDKNANTSIPIVALEIVEDGPGDFSIVAPFSEATPTYNNFTYIGQGGQTSRKVESFTVVPFVRRSKRSQALMYSMFSVNWVLTACSIVTTSIMFKRRGKVKEGVALLPIAVILGIPTLRGFYPGTPPFGILLDVVGFFPQILIVTVCTAVVMCKYAIHSPEVEAHPTGKSISTPDV